MAAPSPSHRFSSTFFSQAAGLTTLGVGGLVLAGWAFNLPTLKSVLPGLATMKVNSALCFVLAGAAVWLLTRSELSNGSRRLAQVGGSLVTLIGLLTLIEYLFGWNLGIDQWLVKTSEAAGTLAPGRMAFATAANFFLMGLAILFLTLHRQRLTGLAQWLSLVTIFSSLLALIGYAYDVQSFYQIASFGSVAVHTAATFFILALGLLGLRSDEGLMHTITRQTAGGVMARRLLVATILIPFGLGWLRLLGEQLGFYDGHFGLALFATSNIVVFVVLIYWNAKSLNRMDAERQQSAAALRQAHTNLENQVRQRTAELVAANLALQAEIAERERIEGALRESETRLSKIFRLSPVGIVISRQSDGTFLDLNDSYEKMLGYPREELIGHRSSEFNLYVNPEERAEILRRLREEGAVNHYEIQVRAKSGEVRDIMFSLEGVELDGEACLLVVNYDITEHKRAKAKVLQLNADLEQKLTELEATNRELEAFSYSVSHDLRAPLRAMNGFAQILLEEYLPQFTPEARHYLELVSDNAIKMGGLIDDLLAFSRLSRQPLTKRRVAPTELVRQALAELQALQAGRQVEVTVGFLPPCEADPALLKQVFVNLLENALKYSCQRKVALIEIGFHAGVYFVKDNGIGFEMQYADKLFGVFQRLHGSEDFEGTGVGLAIVERVITRHGGRIWAEATLNQGATFYFTLTEVEPALEAHR